MAELRVEWRMATWWQCALLLPVMGFFGRVVVKGLESRNPHLWPHVLVPPFAPIVVGGNERIPRDEVAFVYCHGTSHYDSTGR